jgi:hypothetical protein
MSMTTKRKGSTRDSYRRKGGLTGTGVNLKQRKPPENPFARNLMCRLGCSAKFNEVRWLEKHERDFHDGS